MTDDSAKAPSPQTKEGSSSSRRKKKKQPKRPYIRRRWYKRPKIVGGIVLGILLVLLVAYKPAKLVYNKVRFENMVLAGEAALEEGRRLDVERAIVNAWNYSNKSTGQVSKLFKLAVPIRSNQTVHLARFLLETDDAPLEDYATALDALAQSRYQDLFQQAFDKLPADVQQQPEIQFAYVRFLGYNDRATEAIPLAEALLENQEIPKIRLALIDLYAAAGDESRYQNLAARLIRSILEKGDTPEGVQAFSRIFKLKRPLDHFRPEYLENWVEKSSAELTEPWFVLQSLIVADLYPELKRLRVEEIFNRYKDTHPNLVARFVVNFGGADLLEKLPDGALTGDPLVFTAYVGHQFDRYFAALKAGEPSRAAQLLAKADGLLAEAPDGVGRPFVEACRAAIAFLRDDPGQADYYRKRALRAARFEGSFNQFFEILRIADRFGDRITAREAVLIIAEQTTKFLPSSDKLDFFEKYLTSKSDLGLLLELYRRLRASRPDDLEAALKLSTLLVTSGGDLEEASAAIRPWSDGSRRRLELRTRQALIELAQGNSDQALKLIDRPEFNFYVSGTEADKAIYATVLKEAGRTAVAESFLTRINWSALPHHLYSYLKDRWPELPNRETNPVREG